MAAVARWAYGEYQSTVFDEVSVCIPSAVYSSWPLSREAPLDTYGGNLFKFFGRGRKSLRDLGLMFLGFRMLWGGDYK